MMLFIVMMMEMIVMMMAISIVVVMTLLMLLFLVSLSQDTAILSTVVYFYHIFDYVLFTTILMYLCEYVNIFHTYSLIWV